jgi:hypothetical protein
MSIKIFNGYILRNKTIEEAFLLLKSIQNESIELAQEKIKNLIKEMKISNINENKSDYFIEIVNIFDELKRKVINHNESIPKVDYTCDLVIIPYENDVLILRYTEQPSLYDSLLYSIGIEDFYYWNNVDKPEEISDSHWNKRKIIWQKSGILEIGKTPSQSGLLYSLVSWNNYDNLFNYI